MSPTVFCRVCAAPHARAPLYACAHCGAVLCPDRTPLVLTGKHWVRERGALRVCGSLCRTEIRSDMTCATVGGDR